MGARFNPYMFSRARVTEVWTVCKECGACVAWDLRAKHFQFHQDVMDLATQLSKITEPTLPLPPPF